MLRRLFVVAATGALLTLPAIASAQSCQTMTGNLVQNCSFEQGLPVINGADYPFASVSGWISTGNATTGTFERWTNGFDGFFAKDGNSHLELQVNSSTSIEQYLATSAGLSYILSFWAADRPGNGYSQIDVYVNNVFLTSTGQIYTPYQWQQTTAMFTATGASTLVEFRSMGNQVSYGDFIDNVSVQSTVPEPSTFAMLGVGLLGAGLVVRRRRRGSK